jgi:hypothetical protein
VVLSIATAVTDVEILMGDHVVRWYPFFFKPLMTVLLETSRVRPRSDGVRRDIRLSSAHPIAVGSDVRVGRFGRGLGYPYG